MISIEDLIKQISNTMGKKKVLELSRILREEQFALRDLIDLTFYDNRDIAFRAVWILENVFLKEPLRYQADIEYLVSRIKDVKHASCKRHYAKIMMHITAKKAPPVIRQKLQQMDLEPVVEQCFDWMIDPKVLVAVKIFASEALFNLSERYPWIKEELADQVKFLTKTGSAAMQSMGRMLLDKLGRQ
jgi:hypothetical protein